MEKLPAQMTVIGISKPGGPEVLLPETRSVPVPGPGDYAWDLFYGHELLGCTRMTVATDD